MRIPYLFRVARSSYNQTTLISRSTVLNSGSPINICGSPAWPVLRQNNPLKTSFSPLSTHQPVPIILGRRELYREVDPATALVPEAIPKDQLFVPQCSELRPVRRRNHKIEELNPSILFPPFINEQLSLRCDDTTYRGLICTLRHLIAPPGAPFSRLLN